MKEVDFFICHATEDKDAVARPIAEALRARGYRVWYDEYSLSVGDSLRRQIDLGLAESHFAVVILSPSFFSKEWPQRELDALVARETAERDSLILPVWHNISKRHLVKLSPTLADKIALSTKSGIDAIADDLVSSVREYMLREFYRVTFHFKETPDDLAIASISSPIDGLTCPDHGKAIHFMSTRTGSRSIHFVVQGCCNPIVMTASSRISEVLSDLDIHGYYGEYTRFSD